MQPTVRVGCADCPGLHYPNEPVHGAFLRWVSTEGGAPELRGALGGVLGLHEAPELHEVLAVALKPHEAQAGEPEPNEVRRVAWVRSVVPTQSSAWVRGEIRFAAWVVFQSVAQGAIRCELPVPDATAQPELHGFGPLEQDAIRYGPPE